MTEERQKNINGAIVMVLLTTGLVAYVIYTKHYYLLVIYIAFLGYQFLKYSKWGKKFRRKIRKSFSKFKENL